MSMRDQSLDVKLWVFLLTAVAVRAIVPDLIDALAQGGRTFAVDTQLIQGRAHLSTVSGQLLDWLIGAAASFRLADVVVRGVRRPPWPALLLLLSLGCAYLTDYVAHRGIHHAMIFYGLA